MEILRMVDSIVNAVKNFPRIEAKMYADINATNIFLKVKYYTQTNFSSIINVLSGSLQFHQI